jgi:cobalt/nickel transport system ATP-binding protein
MAMSNLILEIKNGTYSYEDNRCAIHNINIKINKGEKIAIIGNNGAGKSTFFLALMGVVHLHEGDIFLHGKKIEHKRKDLLELRKKVGMVFQDPDNQIIASTVEGEISFGLFNIGQTPDEVRRNVDDMMTEMNLTEYANRPPHFLSGGEKKRVSIADILVMKPEIVLFDEPTASLDCKNTQLFKERIDKLHKENVTLLVSTHDMNFVWEWADRVIVFSGSEMIADDVPEMIFVNETILEQAALQKPILFELSQKLLEGMDSDKIQYPKSVNEFLVKKLVF